MGTHSNDGHTFTAKVEELEDDIGSLVCAEDLQEGSNVF